MSFDPVAWFMEGGRHSANVARNIAFAAFQGRQGIINPKDMEVRELAVPGTSVRVFPGTCAVLNSFTDGEMYGGRVATETQVPIAATGASPRSDMIVARVVNPYLESFPGSGWPALDPDPELGPFFAPYVISNVGTSATRISDTAEPNISGIPLARIDMPASTSTVDQAYITDLRKLAGVLNQRDGKIRQLVDAESDYLDNIGTWEKFPNISGCDLATEIPEWATHARVRISVENVWLNDGANYGGSIVQILPDGGGQITTPETRYDLTATATVRDNFKIIAGDTVAIPEANRGAGATVNLICQKYGDLGGVSLFAQTEAIWICDIEYLCNPEPNV